MKWKNFIKEQTIAVVARELGLTYEAVRLWMRGHTTPSKKHIKKLILLSGGRLKFEDFFDIE